MAKTKRKSSTSKRRSPGALGGRAKQTPWSRLGISKKQYEAANKWGSKMANLPQGKKFRKEVKKRVQRASPQDLRDIKPIARNVAGMAGDVEKWVKTQAPRNLQNTIGGSVTPSVSTQAQMAKKTKDIGRDIALMGEYPTEGDFQRARSFRSSRKEPLAEGRFEGGGPVKRNSRDGYARGGLTKVAREDDSATLMQAGGYLGGLTESGRGTMAGELGPRGSLPVREAGETMYERSKRRRGFKGGGAVSSYNRRYNNQNK
tara:strand:- start:142 stop:918 length:777 start_codon:yes stop_codon:yes gene_type:complete